MGPAEQSVSGFQIVPGRAARILLLMSRLYDFFGK
jgi:hypothetical protein